MIQETYKISVARREDSPEVLKRLETILNDVRQSEAYRKANCVYAKLLMGEIPMKEAEQIAEEVKRKLPKAVVAGMSLTLPIDDVGCPVLTASFCYFAHGTVSLLELDGIPEDYGAAGRAIGQRISGQQDVRAVELFCVVMNVDIAPFVLGLAEGNEEIPFFGSLAGMDHHWEPGDCRESVFYQKNIKSVFEKDLPVNCFVLGSKFHRAGCVMVVFSGKALHVHADYLLSWKPLGKELTVTRAVSPTCVATIDDIPATEIYRKYLNVLPDERFLLNICEFPMLLDRDGCLIARTPPIFDEEGKLYFIADIHEGEKLRLSYAKRRDLLQETQEASSRMWEFCPEGVFLIICPNRSVFLAEDAPKELAAYHRLQPQLAVSFGPGEIYRYRGKGGVLNSSLIAVGIREGDCPEATAPLPEIPVPDRNGKPIPLSSRLAAFLDATTKELQESNRELQSMAEAARAASVAKSQFLSNMSHEIRTPINAVLGMNEMILREAREPSILEYAENVRMAGSSLLGLINDILDFSKIEAGKIDIIPVEYALSSVLNDLVSMIQPRAEKKGLSFAVNTAPDLPNALYGDEIRIKQIITNILTNAVKYTERGFVFLSVDYERKDANTIRLRVSVKDSGIGIKEADLKKLFAAFERIEEKRNRSIEGTGLGMNITKRLLALMGSKLDVESVYGKGSNFSFTLEQRVMNWEPMGDFDEAYHRSFAQRKAYSEKFTAPDAHILVVDDTPMNLTVVKGLLKQTKVQIDTAKSGCECLELVKKKKYDIIFLDHRMPEMDGIETLHHMQGLEGNLNGETPVISLTANAVSGAREEYISAGFRDYLTKPIDGIQLETMILQYLPPERLAGEETPKKEAPPPKADALPEWLAQVNGLDTAEGVMYCGSAEAYLEVLSVFAEAIVPNAKEIAHYFEIEDWKDFTTKVHSLKSTSRVIGAKELSERAKYLEDAGNRGDIDTIKNCSDDLLQLYLAYAFRLAPLCKVEEDDDGKPSIDQETLAEAYGTLREMTASFDYDNLMFVLRSLEEYRLPDAEQGRYQALRDASRKPDWDRLREILGEVP